MTIQQLKAKAIKLRAQAKIADKGGQPAGHIFGDKLRAQAATFDARAATITAALNIIRGEVRR